MDTPRFTLNPGRRLIAIMAIDEAGGIGKNGQIPWDYPEDRVFFKSQTLAHPLIVGRRTFESWGGRPLPGRPCAIWTHHPKTLLDQTWCEPLFASDDSHALVEWGFGYSSHLYVCGGKMLYETLWQSITDLIVTRIPGHWHCDIQLTIDDTGFSRVRQMELGSCRVEYWVRSPHCA